MPIEMESVVCLELWPLDLFWPLIQYCMTLGQLTCLREIPP